MIYQHQLNRIIADVQCKAVSIADKAATLLKKGKVSCANEHVQNLHIVRYYMDTIMRYYPFRYTINTSFEIQVSNPNLNNVRITLTLGDQELVYEGSGSSGEIILYFKDLLLGLGYEVSDSSSSLIAYTSCNVDPISVNHERLDYCDSVSSSVVSESEVSLCDILDDRNCITTYQLNCMIESMYCIVNKYCEC